MRAALVVNPEARHGAVAPADIVERLAARGVEATPFPVAGGGVAAALREALAGGYEAIIVGGGDGTLSTACDVFEGSTTPLGVLPLGTANDFARSVGIPLDLDEAIATVAAGHTIAVDVGVANGRRFLNAASLGMPVKVSAAITPDLKRHLGILAYPLAAARALLQQRPFTVRLLIDGRARRVRWVMQLAVASGRHYGGGLTVTDTARPTDGYLHLHVITAPNLAVLLWTLRHLHSGRYARGDSALRYRARRVKVLTRHRQRVNIDGELVGSTPLEVTLLPHALRVFAPPRRDGP